MYVVVDLPVDCIALIVSLITSIINVVYPYAHM